MIALVALLPWWVSLIVAVVTAPAMIPLVRAVDRHLARTTRAQTEETTTHERESTERHRLRFEADRGAFERAFAAKADEHRECIEEVKGLRDEVVRNRDEIADVRVALERCEGQHREATRERERDRAEHAHALAALRAEIQRVDRKTTPPHGTPGVGNEE